jgi:hypothetical protein
MFFKKYAVLIGVLLSFLLLFIATMQYPGGSQFDAHSGGFSWRHNYLCNLLNPVAVNGTSPNPSQPWAIAGVLSLCFGVAVFFIHFSKKIPQKSASNIIKFAGAGAMAFGLFMATPLHDLVATISGTLLMLSLFYISVFVFRSKLHFFKILAVLSLLSLYVCTYVYFTQHGLAYLPVLQKVNLGLSIALVLGLEYFTVEKDFLQTASTIKH